MTCFPVTGPSPIAVYAGCVTQLANPRPERNNIMIVRRLCMAGGAAGGRCFRLDDQCDASRNIIMDALSHSDAATAKYDVAVSEECTNVATKEREFNRLLLFIHPPTANAR